MIEKVERKFNLDDPNAAKADLEYWLSRPPGERIAAVEFLRRQLHGSVLRLARVARVFRRGPSGELVGEDLAARAAGNTQESEPDAGGV